MLRLAVQHVNRLKPRFLLVSGMPSPHTEPRASHACMPSDGLRCCMVACPLMVSGSLACVRTGDLTNAWPSAKTREIVAAQASGFKEV